MTKYRFEDIAYNSTEKKKPVEEDKYTYIGLEHLDPQCFEVTRYGSEVAPIGEKLVMKKGDVLFGKRRAYQKKVAIAPFDGIFSAHGMVLRPKEKVIDPKFFPMFIASDYFLDSAIKISVGSLSPTINWSALKELEFELPDLNKQRELAELLWAAEETKHSYQNLIEKSETLLQAEFQKMLLEASYKEYCLEELSLSWLKGQPFKKTEIVAEGENDCIHYGELFTTYGPIVDTTISRTNSEIKCASKVGDILFPASDVTPNGLARCSTIELKNVLLGGDIIIMRPKSSNINTKYLSYAINAQKEQLLSRVTGSLVRHISAKSLKSVIVPIPAQNIQDRFVDFAEQLEISKKSITPVFTNVKSVIKSIINQNITQEVSHV